LKKSGGIAKRAKLEELWTLVPTGQSSRLNQLLDVVGGNANRFDELADTILDLERKAVPSSLPTPSNLSKYNLSDANMKHFLDGHTYDYLQPNLRKNAPRTTLWPQGTTPDDINRYLEEALDELAAEHRLPAPGFPEQVEVNGIWVQVGTQSDGAGGIRIGQFFPTDANTTFVSIVQEEMRAILDIFP
jgi:hypothetical protein